MGRLIDTDALLNKLLKENQRCITSTGHELSINMVVSFINNEPTSYDLEEVLAELEVDTVNVDAIIGRHIVNVKMINADRAMNIVKAGGTDGKIDRCRCF